MRTPAWESSPGALAAFLNTARQRVKADLLTITLAGGQVLRYTDTKAPVTINGSTYVVGPQITRGRVSLKVGIQVDTLDLTFAADPGVLINGTPFIAFIRAGGFDGARVVLHRAYAPDFATPWVGTLMQFPGRVGKVMITRYEAKVTVQSDLALLNVMVPRDVYQPGCLNTLFDSGCGLLASAFTVTSTAAGATDITRTIFSNSLVQASGYFDLGVVKFTTGLNTGVARTLRGYTPGQFVTIAPWPFAVAAGDAFTVYPGCDKTTSTCAAKYANLQRFRGHPYVPSPETVT